MTDRQTDAAARQLVRALRRLHREQPLVDAFRSDAVIARVAAEPADPRPASHRGASGPPDLAVLARALDGLVDGGEVIREGRRIRLAGRQVELGPEMRSRADELLEQVRRFGAAPPPVERLARRLGIPDRVVDYLRRSGALVSIGPGIDLSAEIEARLRDEAAALISREGPITVSRYRDAIGTGRRHAVALLEFFDRTGLTDRDGDLRTLQDQP